MMVSLKLSQPGLFGPPQLEDPAAGGIGIWPAQVTVGLLCDTVPDEGVAPKLSIAGQAPAEQRATAANTRGLKMPDWEAGFFFMTSPVLHYKNRNPGRIGRPLGKDFRNS